MAAWIDIDHDWAKDWVKPLVGAITVLLIAIARKMRLSPKPPETNGNGTAMLKQMAEAQTNAFSAYTAGGLQLLAQAQKEIEDLREENRALRAENEALGDQLQEWQGKSTRLTEDVKRQNDVIDRLNIRVASLSSAIKRDRYDLDFGDE